MTEEFISKIQKEVVPALKSRIVQERDAGTQRLPKWSLNAGIGRFVKDAGYIDNVEKTLGKITGQKPVRTKAKKAISNFKIRQGQEIGVMVTFARETHVSIFRKISQCQLCSYSRFSRYYRQSF